MGFLDWFRGRKKAEMPAEPCAADTLRKLVSGVDEVFGDGLSEVEAMGVHPVALATLREAIRRRAKRRNVRFYEPAAGLAHFDADELRQARARIVQLAKSHALLADPEGSGRLLSAFAMAGGFQDVVVLAYEVRDVGGVSQSQAFQLLYNQNRLAAMSGRRAGPDRGESVANPEPAEEPKSKSIAGKTRKCIRCGTAFGDAGLQCPACGSTRFLWE